MDNPLDLQQLAASKKRRNLPGTPDPHAEVIALSPRTLMATNRFVCEVCGKGFQRDQNLQLHRRGHNLPWKLKQRDMDQEVKKRVYVCPEVSCAHHDPSRALGDLTGIKKHFFRKHGEKKWKCEKCSKRYAVHSDWKAHQKVCGTREYRCDCGTLFSRRDSFITHRAFCDALAEETAKISTCNPMRTSRDSNEPDGNGTTGRVPGAFEALRSPFATQFINTELNIDVPVREASRLMIRSDMGGVDSVARPNYKGPALSLSLGTGPGPGPPDALHMLNPFPHADNSVVAGNEGAVYGEETTQWPGPVFASLLDLPKNSSSETWRGFSSMSSDSDIWNVHRIGSNASAPMSVGSSFRNCSVSHFAPPSSADASSFLGNGYYSSTRSSSYQKLTGSAQLPATALLQKAAMMGVTASIPSLFHGYGGDVRFPAMNEASRQDSYLGVTGSLSASHNSLWSSERQSTSCSSSTNSSDGFGAQLAEGSLYPAMCSTDQAGGSMQEMLNSLCSGGGAALFQSQVDNPQPSLKSNGGGSMQGHGAHHYSMGSSSDIFLDRSVYQDGSTLAGLSGADQIDGTKTTLDFLGVGGRPGGMAGGMAPTLSQREIAGISTVSAGIERETANPGPGITPAARVEGESSSLSQGR